MITHEFRVLAIRRIEPAYSLRRRGAVGIIVAKPSNEKGPNRSSQNQNDREKGVDLQGRFVACCA